MVKIILIFITILSFFDFKKVNASYEPYMLFNGDKIQIQTKDGDSYVFEVDMELKKYRVVLNNKIALDIDLLDNKKMYSIKTFESNSYVYFYGSIEEDELNTIPYILRISKDMAYYDIHFDSEEINGLAHYESLIEYSSDLIIAVEFYDGIFDFIYKGNYRLVSFNKDLEIIKSLDLGTSEAKVSITYDLIEVKDSYNRLFYFDREFNKYDGIVSKETKYGYFELDTTLYVNDKLYEIGTVFNTPGRYVLSDKKHENKIILLEPTITFNDSFDKTDFIDEVSYKISGGDVYIDSIKSPLNGKLKEIGVYTIVITGINNYITTKTIRILPYLITKIGEDGTLEINDLIEFTGEAILNGERIESSYKITSPGDYTLSLILNDEIIETYNFSVNDITSDNIRTGENDEKEENTTNNNENNDETIKYILIFLGAVLMILIISVTKDLIKNRKYKKENSR